MSRYILVALGAAIGAIFDVVFSLSGVAIALGAGGGLILAYYSKR